ncbi:mannitol dehydrogenase family protein [Halomonas sp. JS92-SW72]|uniref:mannitol dehydrogenase family protein n=1 Tax=Halomonas sp. JS92-SW72 TaxID=2306583 RepID=UPI000E5A28B8|nr:mannitol dehydrogenase family protein [Halomonas sp. JS92-SW72]AXY41040.1 mannitol dehydrogenase family protein [Halomonas sp. JS92-SW72]
MALPLSQKSLAALGQDVGVPAYDRRGLAPGILHIGLGNFHRSHMAVYLDRLLERGEAHDWAIIGSGVMPADARMRKRLQQQDWLTTIVDLDPGGSSARVVGAMVDFVPVEPAAIVKALCDPRIRIVSLTITEGGYFLDTATGRFDASHPRIRADAAAPSAPRTLFGMLVKALAERRARGLGPFTVLSCDNLPGNGNITRHIVVGLAELIDPDLADWIRREVTFPNSMVDCITPRTTARERELVSRRFGIRDAAPVVCEPFRQWVVEDRFCAGRPRWETVGVQFVDDVSRHETMKLRILNAGHASIAYLAALLGYRHVHRAVADPDIRDWLLALQQREIIPLLEKADGVDYRAYLEGVLERFGNAEVGDTVARLCASGSTRQPKFVLPVIRDALARGRPIEGLALELALWCHFCRKAGEGHGVPALSDPLSSRLREGARRASRDPQAFLGVREIFHDLVDSRELLTALAGWLAVIDDRGARSAVRRYVVTGAHGASSFQTS